MPGTELGALWPCFIELSQIYVTGDTIITLQERKQTFREGVTLAQGHTT